MQTLWATTLYNLFGDPDVFFVPLIRLKRGQLPSIPVPLYNVQYHEVARSQDLLQYRALGSTFLAQQKGIGNGKRTGLYGRKSSIRCER